MSIMKHSHREGLQIEAGRQAEFLVNGSATSY